MVWFGEGLPADIWVQSERAMQESDLIMVIGTSAVVYPAAGLVGLAGEAGVPIVEINPEPALQNQAITLQGTAAEVLPELLSEISK